MALPRNINIQQDPLAQALDMFQQVFHGAASTAIEQRGIIKRRNTEKQEMKELRDQETLDRRTVQALDLITREAPNANPDRIKDLLGVIDELPGSKFLSPLISNAKSLLADELKRGIEAKSVTDKYTKTIKDLTSSIKSHDDFSEIKNALDAVGKTEKAYLAESAGVRKENIDAYTATVNALKDLKTMAMAKARIFQFDDPNQKGFQFDESLNLSELEKGTLFTAKEELEIDPIQSRKTLSALAGVNRRSIELGLKAEREALKEAETLRDKENAADLGYFVSLGNSLKVDKTKGVVDDDFKEKFGTPIQDMSGALKKFNIKAVLETQDNIGQKIKRLAEYGELDMEKYNTPKKIVDYVLELEKQEIKLGNRAKGESLRNERLKTFDFKNGAFFGFDSKKGRPGSVEHQLFFNLIQLWDGLEQSRIRLQKEGSAFRNG